MDGSSLASVERAEAFHHLASNFPVRLASFSSMSIAFPVPSVAFSGSSAAFDEMSAAFSMASVTDAAKKQADGWQRGTDRTGKGTDGAKEEKNEPEEVADASLEAADTLLAGIAERHKESLLPHKVAAPLKKVLASDIADAMKSRTETFSPLKTPQTMFHRNDRARAATEPVCRQWHRGKSAAYCVSPAVPMPGPAIPEPPPAMPVPGSPKPEPPPAIPVPGPGTHPGPPAIPVPPEEGDDGRDAIPRARRWSASLRARLLGPHQDRTPEIRTRSLPYTPKRATERAFHHASLPPCHG